MIRLTERKTLFLTLLFLSLVKAQLEAKITVTGMDRYLSGPSAEQAMKIKVRCLSLF